MSPANSDKDANRSALSDPAGWIETHGDALFAFALRYVKDRSTAEDLVQDALLAALKSRSSFAGQSSERTWMISILKHKVMDYFRKSGRETSLEDPERVADDDSDYVTSGPEAGTWDPRRRPKAWSVDPNDPVEKQQFWQHLKTCLDGLDERLARVYRLRDIEEVDYDEVCNVLAVKPTHLRVLLHRARKALRRCLESNWIGE